ncbi:MAG TPA: beta-ketoacyl synthase chain length factor [Polyangiales bacterium]
MNARVAIAGMGLHLPGYPNLAAWLSRTAQPGAAPSGALLDKHSRRRASDFTKGLADAYAEALGAAQQVLATHGQESALRADAVASVFGSALGEVSTMISLLEQMWREGGALSPMRFAGSVHNAAAGVVSIGSKNTGFTTSLGADHDTPAMSLIEAISLVATRGEPVMVACGDEAAPSDLVGGAFGWDALCCAVVLLPAETAPATLTRLSVPELGEATLEPPELPDGFAHNPNAGLLDLIELVAQGKSGRLRLDRGRGRGYCVDLTRTP